MKLVSATFANENSKILCIFSGNFVFARHITTSTA
jgi:hypothetical protein